MSRLRSLQYDGETRTSARRSARLAAPPPAPAGVTWVREASMAKQKSPQRRVILRTPARRLLERLEQADTLIRRKQWLAARAWLLALTGSDPDSVEVWGRLVNVYAALDDMLGYQGAAERLLALDPRAHDVRPGLANAYLRNGLPTLALRTLRAFVRLTSEHPDAADARRLIARLELGTPALLVELGLTGGAALKLAELHEEAQSALNQGDYARARQLTQTILRQQPQIAPVLNNLTLAYAADGHLEDGLATTERVLAFEPDNVHALSNRARILALLGRFEAGRTVAARLLASTAPAVGGWLKRAEALSYVGLDQELLDLFSAYRQTQPVDVTGLDGMLWHLAAAAALRLGREAEARAWWQAALELQPGLELARANLNDLDQPPGERNGPWAYDLRYWLSPSAMRELAREFETGRLREHTQGPASRYLNRHPELLAVLPAWLARGASDMRALALMLIDACAVPALAQAAKRLSSKRQVD